MVKMGGGGGSRPGAGNSSGAYEKSGIVGLEYDVLRD
jgi:hypothetical protein